MEMLIEKICEVYTTPYGITCLVITIAGFGVGIIFEKMTDIIKKIK